MSLLIAEPTMSAHSFATDPALAVRLVQEINRARRLYRLPALHIDPRRQRAAGDYAELMLCQNNGSDHQLDGGTPWDRIGAAGYAAARVAENLSASALADAATLVAWWLRSPTPRTAILSHDLIDI